MAGELDEVKYQVAVANRILAELGLATGILASLGHASMRVPSAPDTALAGGAPCPAEAPAPGPAGARPGAAAGAQAAPMSTTSRAPVRVRQTW